MAVTLTGSQMRELFPHALDGYVQAIAQGGRFSFYKKIRITLQSLKEGYPWPTKQSPAKKLKT